MSLYTPKKLPNIDIQEGSPVEESSDIVTIYAYDPDTFQFLYSLVVDISESESIEKNSTFVPIPEYNIAYEVITFNLATRLWEIVIIPSPLTNPKIIANQMIDTAISTVLHTISTLNVQAYTGMYELKYNESLKYMEDGQPTDLTDYPFLEAGVGATASSAVDYANVVITKHNEYVNALVNIEKIRLTAKNKITAVEYDGTVPIDTLIDKIDAIAKTTIDALLNY